MGVSEPDGADHAELHALEAGKSSWNDDSHYTAFRLAERQYRARRDESVRGVGRRRRTTLGPDMLPPDMTAVIDHRNGSGSLRAMAEPLDGLLALLAHPGAYILPGALSAVEQRALAVQALYEAPDPPSRTSLSAAYGPLPGLFEAASRGLRLGRDGTAWAGPDGTGPAAAELLSRLRWATAGRQFAWGSRAYDNTVSSPVPPGLVDIASRLALYATTAAGFDGLPAGSNSPWVADSVITNYYGVRDSLCGHTDDTEADVARPLVSISLGLPAIFLIGGQSRDDPVSALALHSGDALLLVGPARWCYHGVACILPASLSHSPTFGAETAVGEYMSSHRINISVRHCT